MSDQPTETRQPRDAEDYMNMIMQSVGANTPMDAWQWVEDRKHVAVPIVFTDKEGRIGYARGIKAGSWLTIAQAINKMVEDTTI